MWMKKVISSLLLLLVYAAYGDDEIYSATLENGGYSSKFLIQKGNYDDPVARGKLSGSIQKSG